jgi:hypothetical protein
MTRERAKHILNTKILGGGLRYAFPSKFRTEVYADGMTKEEHDAVHDLWMTMPGTASFFSAVCEIAAGRLTTEGVGATR